MSLPHIINEHLRKVLPLLAITSLVALFSSCVHQAGRTIEVYETAGYQPNHGPFDSNGNYVDKWADSPPRRRYISRDKTGKQSAARPPQYVAAQPAVAPAPVKVYTPQEATAPKRIVVTAKPKRRPPRTHTVQRGDTLYGLSRKYGTSVSSIQKANRIKGTTIGLGQRLIIPR